MLRLRISVRLLTLTHIMHILFRLPDGSVLYIFRMHLLVGRSLGVLHHSFSADTVLQSLLMDCLSLTLFLLKRAVSVVIILDE